MREMQLVTGALQGAGLGKRGPDHRRPVLWRDARHRHRTYMREAVETLVDGDTVTIDLERRRLDVALSDTQVSDRLSRWRPPKSPYSSGVLAKYARLVADASHGAITDWTSPAAD